MEKSEIRRALEDNSKTPNYNRWIYGNFKNFLGQGILEIGAGIGNITSCFENSLDKRVILVEIMDEFLEVLEERYGRRKEFRILKCDVSDESFVDLVKGSKIATVLCINVLEHIQDDLKALSNIRKVIENDANFIILAPAFKLLFSRWDKAVGHYRRYNKKGLLDLLDVSGFKVEEVYYMNFVGFFGWLVNAKLLNFSPGGCSTKGRITKQAIFFDRHMVDILSKMESKIHPPFGLSIFIRATLKC